ISPVEHDFACRRLVKLSMRDVPICAKLDTGADITVINSKALPKESLGVPQRKIALRGAFGETIEADLHMLPLKVAPIPGLTCTNADTIVELLCAVTPKLQA